MKTVSNGVFESPSGVDTMVARGAPAMTLSSTDGLSSLGRYVETDAETLEALQKRIVIPGAAVTFEVMNVPGPVEREQGYWSVKRGDQELVQILRTHSRESDGPLAVVVWTPEIATTEGIKVGDTFASLAAKHPDVKCAQGRIADTILAFVLCRANDKQLGYIIDPDTATIKTGKVTPDSAKIIAISHEFP